MRSLVWASIRTVAFVKAALQLHGEITLNFSGPESCSILIQRELTSLSSIVALVDLTV